MAGALTAPPKSARYYSIPYTCKYIRWLFDFRYGREIYKHALHWSQTGKPTGWTFYEAGTFPKCPEPGCHYCLDQFIADGSLMFTEPTP